MAHAQKPDFVFRWNGRLHLNRRGRQFSRLLAAEACPSAVVMLETPCSEVVWRVLATCSIRQFPLHFPTRASPCAITFQLESTDERRAIPGRASTSFTPRRSPAITHSTALLCCIGYLQRYFYFLSSFATLQHRFSSEFILLTGTPLTSLLLPRPSVIITPSLYPSPSTSA